MFRWLLTDRRCLDRKPVAARLNVKLKCAELVRTLRAEVIPSAVGDADLCIAEGVDSQTQLDTLAEMGCDQIQGFLLIAVDLRVTVLDLFDIRYS